MKKIILLSIAICINIISSYAATPQQMRFHCEKDSLIINDLLRRGIESGITNPNKLVVQYAHWLQDTPYVANTLEGNEEKLTINICELDCTTFIETLYALTRTTMTGRYSWRDFAHNLESIRYRSGVMDGYASRLHYISDWIMDNSHRGNIKEVTANMSDVKYLVKSIDFMSKNREKYAALTNNETLQRIKSVEIGYRNHRFPIVKKEWAKVKNLKKDLKDGDFIAIVTKIEGLDIQHMGVVITVDNEPYLLHASSKKGKVIIEHENICEYLRHNKTSLGFRVIRIAE